MKSLSTISIIIIFLGNFFNSFSQETISINSTSELGNYCTMMDIIELAGQSVSTPSTISFADLVENHYGNDLNDVSVEDLLNLAEEYEYEGLSSFQKSIIDLESPSLIDQNLEVGKIQGQANVSPNGSFTYSMPIMLPPGSAGMEPQISLNYNHFGRNGHIGYGWSMSGVSAIRHGNQDHFHDHKTDAGGFDNWVFELNGQRLIWNSIDGNGNTVYHLENDYYTRITAYNNNSNYSGIDEFKLVSKDGVTSWYGVGIDHNGSSTNSTVSSSEWGGNSNEQILIWFLNKVEDCNGNYTEYIYENNIEGSEPLLSKIRYTGNNTTTPITNPYNEIAFLYEEGRPDINKTYINTRPFVDGKEMLLSKRLYQINVTTNDGLEPVAQYDLTYCQGWDDAVNYSFLRKIEVKGAFPTEIGGERTNVNPTIFNYGIHRNHNIKTNKLTKIKSINRDVTINHNATLYNGGIVELDGNGQPSKQINKRGVLVTDFNNDGINEIIAPHQTGVRLNAEGTGFQIRTDYLLLNNNSSDINDFSEKIVLEEFVGKDLTLPFTTGNQIVADFNSDGYQDIMLSLQTPYYENGVPLLINKFCHGYDQCDDCLVRSVYDDKVIKIIYGGSDLNNLVEDDLTTEMKQHVLTHTAFVDNNGAYTPDNCNGSQFKIGDFNGDGYTDVLTFGVDRTITNIGMNSPIKVYFHTPELSIFNIEVQNLSAASFYLSKHVRVLDLNGDGKYELLMVRRNDIDNHPINADCNAITQFVNTQDTNAKIFEFDSDTDLTSISANEVFSSNDYTQDHNLYVADFNGDGKNDLLTVEDELWEVSYSNGYGFTKKTIDFFVESPIFNPGGNLEEEEKIVIGDYNGDGKSDIAHLSSLDSTIPNLGINNLGNPKISTNGKKLFIYYSCGFDFTQCEMSLGENSEFDIPPGVAGSGDSNFIALNSLSGDFNGDSKDDLITIMPFANINLATLNIQNESIYMQDVRDGLNHVTHANYQSIAWTENSIYKKSTTENFPFNVSQRPMQVAKSLITTNGLGEDGFLDTNTTTFEYEDLVIHRQGMGMLGFKKFIKRNELLNKKEELTFKIEFNNHDYLTKDLFKRKITTVEDFLGNTSDIEETVYDYEQIDKDGEDSGFTYINRLKSENYVSYLRADQFSNTIYLYDYNDNLGQLITETNRNKITEIYEKYTSNDCSNFDYIPKNITITKERELNYGNIDANINNKRLSYDNKGNVTSSIEYNGTSGEIKTLFSDFDSFGNPQEVETQFYDNQDNIFKQQSIERNIFDNKGRWIIDTYYWEDENHNWIKDANENFKHSTSTNYDIKWGVPLSVTDKISSQDIITDYQYNSFGVLLKERNIFYTFGSSNSPNFYKTYSYNWDIGDFSTDSQGDKDIHNSIFKITTNSYQTPEVTIWYDLLEREVKVEQEAHRNHTIRSFTKYNKIGEIIESTSPFYPSSLINNTYPEVITRYINTYDNFNRLSTTQEITDNIKTTGIEYSAIGSSDFWIETTNNEGEVKRVTFDDLDDLPCKVSEGTDLLIYDYNFNGDIRQIQLFDGSVSHTLSTTNYDNYGFPYKLTEPNSGITEYKYNAIGQLYEQTDARGNITTTEYDNLGRIKSVDRLYTGTNNDNVEGITTYEYYPYGVNGATQVKKILKYNGVSKEYLYDNLGRLKREIDRVNGLQFWKKNFYKANSELLGIVSYSSGFSLAHHYDSNGFLEKVTNGTNTETIFEPTTDISKQFLDASGRYRNYKLGNGRNSQISYKNGYQYPESFWGNGVFDMSFVFNPSTENLESRTNNLNSLAESFKYDSSPYSNDRLTNSSVINFNTGSSFNQIVSYHQNGNIEAKSDVGSYAYDPDKIHAVTQITDIDDKPKVTSLQKQEITYTTYQQPLKISEGDYSLDFIYGTDEQRIKTILKRRGSIQEIKYFLGEYEYLKKRKSCFNNVLDGPKGKREDLGNLKSLENTDGESYFETDDTSNIEELSRIRLTKNCYNNYDIHYINIDGLNAIAVRKNKGAFEIYYTYTDYLGSILTVTDSNADIVTEQSYDAWGQERNAHTWDNTQTPTTKPVWLYRGYTGHEHLPHFSLINMNGRLYDPLLARMLSPDNYVQDETDPQNFNRYSYVKNNPLRYVDPSGEMWIPSFYQLNQFNTFAYYAQNGVHSDEITITASREYDSYMHMITPAEDYQSVMNYYNGLIAGEEREYASFYLADVFNVFLPGRFDNQSVQPEFGIPIIDDIPINPKAGIKSLFKLFAKNADDFAILGAKKFGGRLGKEETRNLNHNIGTYLQSKGYTIKNGGNRMPEEYLKPLGNTRKGGSYVDITATHPKYPTIRINTVDVRKSGRITSRELRNAKRIRTQIPKGEHLILIPKR